MKISNLSKKRISVLMLSVFVSNMFAPTLSYALTSGPSQPEHKGFQQAGTTDMVDLQSGEFKYNIPLLDVDGYPVNLNYQSGVNIDDEASWVGLGWNLNIGSINRQVRGIPDDHDGSEGAGDTFTVEHYTKPKVTVGAKANVKLEIFGKQANPTKAPDPTKPRLSGSLTLGLFSDSYTGVGAEVGANAGISVGFPNEGKMTAGLGLGVLSNTQSGVDASASPYVNMAIDQFAKGKATVGAGLSGSLGYNSRAGLKTLTLGNSFGVSTATGSAYYDFGSIFSYNTEPISPSVEIPYHSEYSSYSFSIGNISFGIFPGVGGTGYKSVTRVANRFNIKPAYGFLYADKGKSDAQATMDFVREKDNPIIPETPNIAIPIHTPDLWSYTSQAGSGQFKLFRGGSGEFFDNETDNTSKVTALGGDFGFGKYFHGGVSHYEQDVHNHSRKWRNNQYTDKGDFQSLQAGQTDKQHVYFKQIGEKNAEDASAAALIGNDNAVRLRMSEMEALPFFAVKNSNNYSNLAVADLKQASRRVNRTNISYLTAAEASKAGVDKKIKIYNQFNYVGEGAFEPLGNDDYQSVDRVSTNRKAHHISEITVTDGAGKRMVYGIPVYNNKQSEYTFAVPIASGYPTNNLVAIPGNVSIENENGIDSYYHRETKSPYATSYLLTSILSPDYVDKNNDGVSNDDLGSAITFGYSYIPKYNWRAPFVNATLNKGLLADPEDDKASVIHGEKELWYVNRIESKTKIAFFVTAERQDGLGTSDNWKTGGKDNAAPKQRYLKEIRLYSKGDRTIPIKVVKFEYSYDLCKGTPNANGEGGKLTLSKVWFEYGNSNKGKFHPYVFNYNDPGTPAKVQYGYMATDRWGVYKPITQNQNGLSNEFFPYAGQDKTERDKWAALWHLNQINLPTGGKITVNYESNDYAYVQDKKATVMTEVKGLIDGNNNVTTSLSTARGIRLYKGSIDLGSDLLGNFKAKCLNGSDRMYVKMFVKMKTANSSVPTTIESDYVSCYAKISAVLPDIDPNYVKVRFEDFNDGSVITNPIRAAAWQKLKNEYPRYAHPGFDNRIKSPTMAIPTAVSAVLNAIGNIGELFGGFYKKAQSRGYASQVDITKSFAKIVKPDGKKLGGGARVRSISISDDWLAMESSGVTANYGQSYDYTTTSEDNAIISSGVVTYEPAIGSDENPLRDAIPYMQKISGAVNNYFNVELPFCESLYPAPSIVYSKVTVTDLNGEGQPSKKTGTVVNEFYTAKDFPVRVTVTDPQNFISTPVSSYRTTGSNSVNLRSISQGYLIRLNDMSGKFKAVKVYDQAGALISSTTHEYRTKLGDPQALDNLAGTVNAKSKTVVDKYLGRDIEFFTDMREQESKNYGQSINIGGDVIPFVGFFGLPFLPIPHWPKSDNDEYKLFRSASALKVVQEYGILKKTTVIQNGSSIATEDLLYDEATGEPVVTRTQNEFNNYIYTSRIPAYWAYSGMGGSYSTSGAVIQNLKTDADGVITSETNSFLQPGDELIDLSEVGDKKYWVMLSKPTVQAPEGGGDDGPVDGWDLLESDGDDDNRSELKGHYFADPKKYLIDKYGQVYPSFNPAGNKLVKVVRSGDRNLWDANAGSIVSLTNPIVNGKLELNSSLKVINASAATFSELWPMSRVQPNVTRKNTPGTFYTLQAGAPHAAHGQNGIKSYSNSPGAAPIALPTNSSQALKDRFDYCSVWPGDNVGTTGNITNTPLANPSSTQGYIGFETDIVVDVPGKYYVGYSGDNEIYYKLDNVLLPNTNNFTQYGDGVGYFWFLYPIQLAKGTHHLHAKARNYETYNGTPTENWVYYNPASIAIEIYKAESESEVISTYSNKTTPAFFSTRTLRGDTSVQTFTVAPDGTEVKRYNYRYYINAYLEGFLGNWRPSQSFVLQKPRSFSNDVFGSANKGIDVKNSGYYSTFNPYWEYNTNYQRWIPGTTSWWTIANTITIYDKYGQQLENKDALGRYSAAKFDFKGELPSVVSSNAQNREIFTDSFEDINGLLDEPHFSAGYRTVYFTQEEAHTGKSSAVISGNTALKLTTKVNNNPLDMTKLLLTNEYAEYRTQTDPTVFYPGGFVPQRSKSYLLSFWAKDGRPDELAPSLTVTAEGMTVNYTKCKAVVEGWKLIEAEIQTGGTDLDYSTISIRTTLTNNAPLYVDDIRLHPIASQMKTYTYDAGTFRLMAELDENCFATLYDYDDEGLLIRVKKETQKGIVTLKESRSSYRKDPSVN